MRTTNQISELFSTLGVTQKTTSKDDLRQWLLDYAALQSTARTGFKRRRSQRSSLTLLFWTSADRMHSLQTPALTQTVISVVRRELRLQKFAGDDGYELWHHQLQGIQLNYQKRDITDASRSCSHCKTDTLLISRWPEATLDDIFPKLDSVKGDVDSEADIMTAFYSDRQGPTATVSDWGSSLELLVDTARWKTPRDVLDRSVP